MRKDWRPHVLATGTALAVTVSLILAQVDLRAWGALLLYLCALAASYWILVPETKTHFAIWLKRIGDQAHRRFIAPNERHQLPSANETGPRSDEPSADAAEVLSSEEHPSEGETVSNREAPDTVPPPEANAELLPGRHFGLDSGPKYRFPGARPFEASQFATFFGRKRESARLARQIANNQLLVVYAKSGVGKTSLLNAGAAPILRQEWGCYPVYVRLDPNTASILDTITVALERVTREDSQVELKQGDKSSLATYVATTHIISETDIKDDNHITDENRKLRLVIIFDQFEELFTLCGSSFRRDFASSIAQIHKEVADNPPRVVFSMREEFVGQLDELSAELPNIFQYRFMLRPLDREGAMDAICRPAQAEGDFLSPRFEITKEAVEKILGDLSSNVDQTGEPRIEPFQLQLVCQRLEHLAQRQSTYYQTTTPTVGIDDLTLQGGAKTILRTFCLEVLKRVRRGSKVLELLQEGLVSVDGRRVSVDGGQVSNIYGVPQQDLAILLQERLLRVERRTYSDYYELSHDALVGPILSIGFGYRRLRVIGEFAAATVMGIVTFIVALGGFALIVLMSAGGIGSPELLPIAVAASLGVLIVATPFVVVMLIVYDDALRRLRTMQRWSKRISVVARRDGPAEIQP